MNKFANILDRVSLYTASGVLAIYGVALIVQSAGLTSL